MNFSIRNPTSWKINFLQRLFSLTLSSFISDFHLFLRKTELRYNNQRVVQKFEDEYHFVKNVKVMCVLYFRKLEPEAIQCLE